MAPTVCLSEPPMMRSTVSPHTRRRQRVHNGAVGKQQRLELRQVSDANSGSETFPTPPESPVWEPECSSDLCAPNLPSVPSNAMAKVPASMQEHWKIFLARRENLLDIVIRTMVLVRRNHILQKRVNALRAETREFIRSVLNNPENKRRQQRLENNRDEVVSSSTQVVSRPSPPVTPDSTSVTSTCCSSDCESYESSSDESEASSCM